MQAHDADPDLVQVRHRAALITEHFPASSAVMLPLEHSKRFGARHAVRNLLLIGPPILRHLGKRRVKLSRA